MWIAVAVLAAGAVLLIARGDHPQRARTGLFTSLPILWSESVDVAALLQSDAGEHWARPLIAAGGRIEPLDRLAGPPGYGPLDELRFLVIAQPRPLAPDENIALDEWVRGGGRLLLLADPALTQESLFSLGDPRRPQGLVLLSPILRRWGLELQLDATQPLGQQLIPVEQLSIPVNLPGQFRLIAAGSTCQLAGQGLLADCRVGRGRVLALADAALLERGDQEAERAEALTSLLSRAFAED